MAANCVGLPRSAAVTLPKPPAERGAPGIPDSRQGAEFQQGSESARVALGTDEETGLRDVECRGPQQHEPRWHFDPQSQYRACSVVSTPAAVMEMADARPVQASPKSITTAGVSQWRTDRLRIFRHIVPTRQAFDGAKRRPIKPTTPIDSRMWADRRQV